MISEGKAAGWLQLPTEAFLPWAKLNDIAFDHALPGVSMGKGGALLASNEVNSNGGTPQALMTVPRSLILSLERVMEHAKVDKDFREVLESLGEFGRPFYGVRLISLASLLLFIDLALVARGHQFIASSEDTAYMY
ncbi:hypothetical protein LTR33_018406 [Friedmanniomyces endolithicus]|nr:hypothetical protein LTR33_018406 [Friedmanniomyces endolithicus]